MDKVLAARPSPFPHRPSAAPAPAAVPKADLDNLLVGDGGDGEGSSFLSRFFSSPSPSLSASSPPPAASSAPSSAALLAVAQPPLKRGRVGDDRGVGPDPNPGPGSDPSPHAPCPRPVPKPVADEQPRARKRNADDMQADAHSPGIEGSLASGTSSECSPHSLDDGRPSGSAGLFDAFEDLAPLSDARMDPDFHAAAAAASPHFPHSSPPLNPLVVECAQRMNDDLGLGLGPVAPAAVRDHVFQKPARPANSNPGANPNPNPNPGANEGESAVGSGPPCRSPGLLDTGRSNGDGGSNKRQLLVAGSPLAAAGAATGAVVANDTPAKISIAFSPHQLTRLSTSPPSSIHSLALPPPTLAHPKSKTRQLVRKPLGGGESAGGAASSSSSSSSSASASSSSRRRSNARSVGGAGKDDGPKRRFCHVCRSPKDISKIVSCCSGKQSHVFCSSCVHRRLGLNFEDLAQSAASWLCPKCEGRCPCSKCRKRTDKQ